jgi:CRISPR/Cas system-associated endoribonuclease Cas2
MNTISDADIARSRADPRFKQVLLAKSLEQLLASLHRMQNSAHAAHLEPAVARDLREGALLAVQLADRIRAIDEQIAHAQAG